MLFVDGIDHSTHKFIYFYIPATTTRGRGGTCGGRQLCGAGYDSSSPHYYTTSPEATVNTVLFQLLLFSVSPPISGSCRCQRSTMVTLAADNINGNLVKAEYAVRGEIVNVRGQAARGFADKGVDVAVELFEDPLT